jgi:chromate transporter
MKPSSSLSTWYKLFWMFLKINLLTSSGPACIGLLYKESVGKIMTEAQFVEAVGFSNIMPGSEALKVAMFVGYAAGGLPGALLALLGAALPPTVSMLIVTLAIQHFQNEPWMDGFVGGMLPAVAVLIAVVAWKLFRSEKKISKYSILIAFASLAAFALGVSTPLVLLAAGVVGIVLFR